MPQFLIISRFVAHKLIFIPKNHQIIHPNRTSPMCTSIFFTQFLTPSHPKTTPLYINLRYLSINSNTQKTLRNRHFPRFHLYSFYSFNISLKNVNLVHISFLLSICYIGNMLFCFTFSVLHFLKKI